MQHGRQPLCQGHLLPSTEVAAAAGRCRPPPAACQPLQSGAEGSVPLPSLLCAANWPIMAGSRRATKVCTRVLLGIGATALDPSSLLQPRHASESVCTTYTTQFEKVAGSAGAQQARSRPSRHVAGTAGCTSARAGEPTNEPGGEQILRRGGQPKPRIQFVWPCTSQQRRRFPVRHTTGNE